MIGQTISHYKILEKLGGGGMGVVYKAEDTKLSRIVALKFLPPHLLIDEEAKERFIAEAKAASSLDHPNICTIYEIGETDDQNMFIALTYYDGETLKKKLQKGPLSLKESIDIAIQICKGLSRAHESGIVHRDIKPANIMITNHGEVKIVDFGLAKTKGSTSLTKVGSTVGTVDYMSPEQAKGESTDHRVDIWAVGILLYEMLSGKLPFKGEYEQSVIYSILNDDPEDIAGMPDEINSIIKKAISKNPDERHENIYQLEQELERAYIGNKISSTVQTKKQKTKSKKIEPLFLSIIILIACNAALIIYFISKDSGSIVSNEKKMIVVLPFENLGSPDDEYFADGITEEITSRLSGLSGLGVIARQSAMQYKDVNKSLEQIANELGVDYILVGTIRWERSGEGDKVRVNSELIRISDEVQIWSEPFEAPYSSSFKLQSQIAAQVANAMDINLLQPEKKSLSINLTENQEAYNLYLKAKDYLNNRNQDPNNQKFAERLFKQALNLDPDFAAAYAGLSRVYSDMYWFHYDHTENRIKLSKDAADKAFQLDPDLYYVYTALAWYYYHCELDYDEALENFQKALKLQPNDDEALSGIGAVLRRQGKVEESIEFFERAVSINPLSAQMLFELASSYYWSKKYSEAIPILQKSRSLDPNSAGIYYYLSACYMQSKDLNKASQILVEAAKDGVPDKEGLLIQTNIQLDIYEGNYEKALNRLKNTQHIFSNQFSFIPGDLTKGIINLYLRRNEEAKKSFNSAINFLNQKITESPDDHRLYTSLGIAYAGLGQKVEAIKWAKKGVELLPISKEALRGQASLNDLAKVYVLVGEYDLAIDLIEELINIPSEITPAILRIDPMWDKLRGKEKFDKLVNKKL